MDAPESTACTAADVAALMAGVHALFALAVRRLAVEGSLDIAVLLTELDLLYEYPEQAPLTRAVLNDAREHLLGVLGAGRDGRLQAVPEAELQYVAPLRRSPELPPLVHGSEEG